MSEVFLKRHRNVCNLLMYRVVTVISVLAGLLVAKFVSAKSRTFLRFHYLRLWSEGNRMRLRRLRRLSRTRQSSSEFETLLPRLDSEGICNVAITLILQAQPGRLLESQQKRFLREDGICEQMIRASQL